MRRLEEDLLSASGCGCEESETNGLLRVWVLNFVAMGKEKVEEGTARLFLILELIRSDFLRVSSRVEADRSQESSVFSKLVHDDVHPPTHGLGQGFLGTRLRVKLGEELVSDGLGATIVEHWEQGILVGEAGVKRPDRRPRAPDDLGDRDLLEVSGFQQSFHGAENPLQGLLTPGLEGGVQGGHFGFLRLLRHGKIVSESNSIFCIFLAPSNRGRLGGGKEKPRRLPSRARMESRVCRWDWICRWVTHGTVGSGVSLEFDVMKIAPFATEQFFSLYEFNSQHLLGVSDCETTSVGELLSLAGRSLDELGELRLGYTESQGHPALREAIAGLYSGVPEDQVVVLSSPMEGIQLAMRALLNPGDRAVVLSPSYDALQTLPEHIAGQVTRWDLLPTEDGYRLDLDRLESLLGSDTRLLVVNFPHNPTGFLPSADEHRALLEIVRKKGVWLFSDEMYRGAEHGTRPRLASGVEVYSQCLVLGGLSKTYGLPGLRSGWLVVPDRELREELINWKHYSSICAPAPIEFLALAALEVGEELARRNRELIGANLSLADVFFDRWKERFRWRRPLAGPVALVGIDVPSATEYCHALARDQGIVLLPGPCLGSDDHHVRFGFGRKSFGEALSRFDEVLGSA